MNARCSMEREGFGVWRDLSGLRLLEWLSFANVMTFRVDSFVTAADVRAWKDWSDECRKGMY